MIAGNCEGSLDYVATTETLIASRSNVLGGG